MCKTLCLVFFTAAQLRKTPGKVFYTYFSEAPLILQSLYYLQSSNENLLFRLPKRKRGRPRKNPRDFDEDFEFGNKFDSDDWIINHIFTCATCDESVQGFQLALDHMNEKHDDKTQSDKGSFFSTATTF